MQSYAAPILLCPSSIPVHAASLLVKSLVFCQKEALAYNFCYVQVVYVEEDEVEAEDPFAPGAEYYGSQGSAEEESAAEDEELQDVEHIYDDDSDCE